MPLTLPAINSTLARGGVCYQLVNSWHVRFVYQPIINPALTHRGAGLRYADFAFSMRLIASSNDTLSADGDACATTTSSQPVPFDTNEPSMGDACV